MSESDCRRFTATMADPDAPRPDNPIHSTDGARRYGFDGALVGGIHVYGWSVPAFVEALGNTWLDTGWVDISFRRPTYAGDDMRIELDDRDPSAFTVSKQTEVCLRGLVGSGAAPFLPALAVPGTEARQPPSVRTALTLENAPVGRPLAPLPIPAGSHESSGFLLTLGGDENGIVGDRHHPAFLAGRMIALLHHSYEYGPAIHTRSEVQHLAPSLISTNHTLFGHGAAAYEKNGHHYIENVGSIRTDTGIETTRLRHTVIFRVRPAPAD